MVQAARPDVALSTALLALAARDCVAALARLALAESASR